MSASNFCTIIRAPYKSGEHREKQQSGPALDGEATSRHFLSRSLKRLFRFPSALSQWPAVGAETDSNTAKIGRPPPSAPSGQATCRLKCKLPQIGAAPVRPVFSALAYIGRKSGPQCRRKVGLQPESVTGTNSVLPGRTRPTHRPDRGTFRAAAIYSRETGFQTQPHPV